MPFQVHDFVRYSGPLGDYRGRVVALDGPRHIVECEEIGRVLCGEADLTADGDALLAAAQAYGKA